MQVDGGVVARRWVRAAAAKDEAGKGVVAVVAAGCGAAGNLVITW